MARKISIMVMTVLTVFLIGYGVILAKESYSGPSDLQGSEVAGAEKQEDEKGDDSLGSLKEQVVEESEEEFPILERDQEKYEDLLAVKEKTITPIIPKNIKIPSLEIDADIIEVGILDDGAMEVPENVDEVGWFEPGVKPGQIGNSVLAGHVDSYEGPAVFFDLRDMQEGDEIIVTGAAGESLTFNVKSLESYPTDGAPIKDIFGPANSRNLNLITCTGSFNRETGEYPDRLVVYTELAEEEPEELDYTPTPPTNVELSGSQLSWHAVRDKEVVGYRIYEELEDGTKNHIQSVRYYERKSLTVENPDAVYTITSVAIDGKESEHAGIEE